MVGTERSEVPVGKEATPMQFTVWLCDAARIASFHPVEGFREQHFLDHQFFLNYLQQLQNQGYRFQ